MVLLALLVIAPAVGAIVNVHDGDVAWGDYDGDGDLDLLVTGIGASGNTTKLYRNDGGSAFTEVSAALPALGYSTAAWGDYDGDRDLDLLLMGNDDAAQHKTILLRNDAGAFTEVTDSFLDPASGQAQWCDYDNDGDLDLSINSSVIEAGYCTLKLYRNDGAGQFAEVYSMSTRIPLNVVWGDFTNDGKTDFAVNGVYLYKNTGTGFSQMFMSQGSTACQACSDYDRDGRLDLAVSSQGIRLLHNEGLGTLMPKVIPIDSAAATRMAWGDYDSDGDPDLLAVIDGTPDDFLRIYRNDGVGVFTTAVNMAAPYWGDLALGDCDNDGDLDIATLSGVCLNNGGGFGSMASVGGPPPLPSAPPSVPGYLQAHVAGNEVILTWAGAPIGLSYNIRVGTTSGASDVFSGMAFSDGKRLLPAFGNASTNQSWRMTLPLGSYYWSVQAIDNAFRSSAWSYEGVFQIVPVVVGWAKLFVDGTTVIVDDSIVTAVFGNSFYVESEDRSHGLRVDSSVAPGVSVGDKVRVGGVMKTDAATERYLQATSIDETGTGAVRPVGMPVKALGGSEFGAQGGIEGALGLNNIGLLVTVYGRYGYSTAWEAPTIDDGSGVPVKVALPPTFGYIPTWLIVKATGISSCFKDPATGQVRRLLKVRDASSITVLKYAPANISGKVFNTGGQYRTTPWYCQTAHPIQHYPSHPIERVITGPADAVAIRLHFSRLTMGEYEYVYLRDAWDYIRGYYHGVDYPNGYWSAWCSGNTIKLDVFTGTFYSASWGFIADMYECEFDNPLAGVTMTLQPGGQTVVTGADGRYSFAGLPAGTYTVTPSYPGATFASESTTLTVDHGETAADTNFTRQ